MLQGQFFSMEEKGQFVNLLVKIGDNKISVALEIEKAKGLKIGDSIRIEANLITIP